MAPYRSAALVPEESDTVVIDREEYSHLRRAVEVLEVVQNQYEDVFLSGYRRRPWQVTLYDGYELAEGVGASFQEAVEDAGALPPVTPWYPDPPRQIPWFRLLLLGAVLGQALLWGLQNL